MHLQNYYRGKHCEVSKKQTSSILIPKCFICRLIHKASATKKLHNDELCMCMSCVYVGRHVYLGTSITSPSKMALLPILAKETIELASPSTFMFQTGTFRISALINLAKSNICCKSDASCFSFFLKGES